MTASCCQIVKQIGKVYLQQLGWTTEWPCHMFRQVSAQVHQHLAIKNMRKSLQFTSNVSFCIQPIARQNATYFRNKGIFSFPEQGVQCRYILFDSDLLPAFEFKNCFKTIQGPSFKVNEQLNLENNSKILLMSSQIYCHHIVSVLLASRLLMPMALHSTQYIGVQLVSGKIEMSSDVGAAHTMRRWRRRAKSRQPPPSLSLVPNAPKDR